MQFQLLHIPVLLIGPSFSVDRFYPSEGRTVTDYDVEINYYGKALIQ